MSSIANLSNLDDQDLFRNDFSSLLTIMFFTDWSSQVSNNDGPIINALDSRSNKFSPTEMLSYSIRE